MSHIEANFAAPDGATIYYQVWKPENARALILLAHGFAEHSGRYREFAEFFNRHGYAVAALDHPGHGRSDGTPGFIPRFDDYLTVFESFRALIAEQNPGLPMILVGHSMGGLIAANYLQQAQQHFCACVLSGPAIKSDVEPPWWQLLLLRLVAKIAPKAGMLSLDAAGVSRDAAVVEAYLSDPLVYTGKISARQAVEMFAGMQQAQQGASKINLPLLVLHGGDDQLTTPEGSRLFCDWVSSIDKKVKIYPSLYHEIFNEPEREEVLQDMLAWCE
ncbi:MAG: lysophospholipase, partial [Gammaproteobacteria bacterium]|nr:lysophospholipase [Gammaproteobacteria bacterium]